MKKLQKMCKKGFTMIELMIVITVIGILAVVLLPRITGVRDDARNSGIEVNMREVQSAIEYVINNQTTPNGLATALKTRIEANENKNPITGLTGVTTNTAILAAGQAPAVHVVVKDSPAAVSGGAIPGYTAASSNASLSGLIGVNLYIDSDDQRLTAEILAYNDEGDYLNNIGMVTVKR